MKEASWSLHFWCIFASWFSGNKFFAFGSASAERNENRKIQVHVRFWSAGRNARGCWREIRGRFEICKFESEDWDLRYGISFWVWHASSCHTARAADSTATRLPPGQATGGENWIWSNLDENRSTNIECWSKIHRKVDRKLMECRSTTYRKSIENLPKIDRRHEPTCV